MIPAIHPLGCFVARLSRTSECLMFSLHQFWAQENQEIELDKTRLKPGKVHTAFFWRDGASPQATA
jgi:hypothetical protein